MSNCTAPTDHLKNRGNLPFYLALIGLSLIGSLFLVWLTIPLPAWQEESGWLCISTKIARGQQINPFLAKSDYPSSFQAFPIGLLVYFGIFPVLASRLVAIAYLVLSAYFFALLAHRFSKGSKPTILLAVFIPFFSYCSVYYSITGWHEVAHVNLLCASMTYFLYSLLDHTKSRSRCCIGMGITLGVSVWTLYTPALVAIIMLFLILLSPTRWITVTEKVRIFNVFLLFIVPLAISVAAYEGVQVRRHYLFYFEGGEWDRYKYSASNTFQVAMQRNIRNVMHLLTPHGNGTSVPTSAGVFPEWSLLIAALMGGIGTLFDRRKCFAVLIPALLTLGGVLLSNPTPWRTSILGFYIILLAIVGVSFLLRYLQLHGKRLTLTAVCVTFAAVQFLEFAPAILTTREVFLRYFVTHQWLYVRIMRSCK